MTEKKKQCSKTEQSEMDIHDMKMQEPEIPIQEGIYPMMHCCPVMCPMTCPMMRVPYEKNTSMGIEDMRSPDWYDEDESDYSSDESDEFPIYWKHKKKHKYYPYPVFWPPFYPIKPYKKKHNKW